MKKLAIATLLLFTTAIVAPAGALAQTRGGQAASPLAIPVTGATAAGAAIPATFTGTFQLQRFATQDGQLVASGLLTGIVTTGTGATATTASVVRTITMPAAVTEATCAILHLDLGPLDLNLLGLQVNLSQIVLDITAVSGAGNLLGNLLCAVAGLLDPGGLSNLLNQILAILG
jgi:hypothetical protein